MDDKEKIRTAISELAASLEKTAPAIKEYAAKSHRTPEEELEYQRLIALLEEGLSVIRQVYVQLSEEMFCNLVAFYYGIKEKAIDGDEKALAIYNDLAPDFGQALLSQIDKN
jgi:hypothetical protein